MTVPVSLSPCYFFQANEVLDTLASPTVERALQTINGLEGAGMLHPMAALLARLRVQAPEAFKELEDRFYMAPPLPKSPLTDAELAKIEERWAGVGELVVVEDIPCSIDRVDAKDASGEWTASTVFLEFCGEDDETMERARLFAAASADIGFLLSRIAELEGKRCETCGEWQNMTSLPVERSKGACLSGAYGTPPTVSPDHGCRAWRAKS